MFDSVRSWLDDKAYELAGGQRLLVRLPPRIGKTYLARQLEKELEGSAVFVDGSLFTESSQASDRDEIEARLLAAIAHHGSAQLIFDNYDRAIARSQGGRLQTWLTSRLIDGDYARDVGAFFTARCSTEIHRKGAGSPLMSRVKPVEPPLLAPDDAPAYAQEWFGRSALLIDQSDIRGSFEPVPVADRFEQDDSFIHDVRKSLATVLSTGHIDRDKHSFEVRCAATGLLTEAGPTKLFDRIHPLLAASPTDDPVWPEAWNASVAKFIQLIAGAHEVIWSDRYIYRDIEALRAFLREVRKKTQCKFLLLGNNVVSDRTVSRAEILRITTVPGVEARFMTPTDYKDLHDRHLVTGGGGWVVPQAHVIVGTQARGSTVAASTVSFGVDYVAIWKRSIIA